MTLDPSFLSEPAGHCTGRLMERRRLKEQIHITETAANSQKKQNIGKNPSSRQLDELAPEQVGDASSGVLEAALQLLLAQTRGSL